MRIAFVQLGSYGDNINSTMMLKPIKDYWQGCTVDVHTTDLYAGAFHNNPYVDRLVDYHAATKSACFDLYNSVPRLVDGMKYDKVIVPAPILHPTRRNSLLHPEFGENIITTFMRVMEDNGIPYEFPVKTVLRLTPDEVHGVDAWLAGVKAQLGGKRNILMEVHGESGQTHWNPDWTTAVGRHLMKQRSNLFISRRDKTAEIARLEQEFPGHVYWAGGLSIRQCAELFNRCDLFMSVSSGLSNACNTDWCKTDIKWVEAVNSMTVTSAPVRKDGKIFWYHNDLPRFLKMLSDAGI